MIGGGRPGEGDVRLLRVMRHMLHPRTARARFDRSRAARVPVTEELLDPRYEVVPVDAASDGDDRAARLHVGGDEVSDILPREMFDIGRESFGRHAPRRRIVDLSQ